MKKDTLYEFLVDKEDLTITIHREFDAPKQTVWDYFTKSDLLNQWFAPKPFVTKTKSMEFKENGHWLYAMVDPEGKEYWGRMDYVKIHPIDHYKADDSFCDDQGKPNDQMPAATWDVKFSEKDHSTIVEIVVKYKSEKDLETILKMGMKEGFTQTLNQLEELLER